MTRYSLLGAVCVCALLLGAGPAGGQTSPADSVRIFVTNSAGQPDPAAGLPRVFTVRGVSSLPNKLYVTYRASGGAACAPSASSDSGEGLPSLYGKAVNGSFSISEARTWPTRGTFVFCMWIASSGAEISAPFTQIITFRPSTGTITAAVDPLTPEVNQRATISVAGASEAPARAYATIRPFGGASCAPTFDADAGKPVLGGELVNGGFLLQATTTQTIAGPYQLCLWLARSGTDPAPIAGPQLQMVYVLPIAPPLNQDPCIVPPVTQGIRLSTMKYRIQANNCSVGKVRYSRNRRVARGAIIRLSSKAGSRLAPGAPVTIYVSAGHRKP